MMRDDDNPTGLYILDDDGQPLACPDVLVWGQWMRDADKDRLRVVAQDKDEGPDGGEVLVSTVFLGTDHRFIGKGPPILWETLVFGGALADEMNRYSSREAALAGHQVICQRVRAAKKE
jgi:hypothetical protein